MNKFLFFILGWMIVVFVNLSADTIIPGGYVSGTWNVAGSPYLVQGNITIHGDSTLTIQPGVEVNFQGFYSFTVNGYLHAVGTETDSIHFFPANTTNGWNTMRFENAPDSSHLAYCTISYSGNNIFGMGGIICTNSNPVITHCRISDNGARGSYPDIAGGIALNSSNAEISWCDISNNENPDYGGGIYISHSSPVITGCNISGNKSVMYGGGIYITGNSSPIITNCTIEGNESNWEGGGIYCAGGVTNFLECTIGYNESYLSGGGIYSATGNMSLNRCTIERNQCSNWSAQGGGIFANGGTLTVDHCTFYGNYIENYGNYGMDIQTGGSVTMTVSNSIFYNDFLLIVFGSTSPASVSYNDFLNYFALPFIGNIPAGLGQLTTTNTNGDSCDVYYNIFLDPLFENPGSGNYQITWANWPNPDSTKSPCIDSGDPLSPLDPDGTVADMGAFYFNQLRPLILCSDSLLDFGIVEIGQALDLSFTLYNGGTDSLRLQNMINQHSVFTHNWNPADSLILPGDSLTITVTFTPADTNLIVDTLLIENNDKPLQVQLSGKGKIIVVGIENSSELPKVYELYTAYPNPFNPSTTIEFDLPRPSFVILKVYNLLGEEVDILISKQMTSGKYKYIWTANNLASGIYFYRLNAGEFNKVRKIILLR
jgi:parallel beta-helix repeat protein